MVAFNRLFIALNVVFEEGHSTIGVSIEYEAGG
jgi:hypothetical protein